MLHKEKKEVGNQPAKNFFVSYCFCFKIYCLLVLIATCYTGKILFNSYDFTVSNSLITG